MSVNLHPEVQEVQEAQEAQEAELANYGGWQEEQESVHEGPTRTQTSGPLPLLDEADYVTPEQVQQDRPWWMRPIPRIIVAGGAVTSLVYVLFLWFGLWRSSSADKPTETLMPTDTAAVSQEVDDRLKQLQTENENLKREQVMGEPLVQTSTQPQPAKAVSTSPPKTLTVSQEPEVVVRRVPPPPVSPLPPRLPPPRPLPQQVSEPRALFVSKSVSQIPKPPPPTLEQQQQKWLALSNVGNWGGDTAPNNTQDNSSSTTTAISQERLLPSGGTGQPPPAVIDQISSQMNARPVSYTPTSEQSQAYQPASYGSAQVMIGTEAPAEIDRTLSWSTSSLAGGMRIPIRLTQPLRAIDNSEAIPAGSYLIAQVNGDSSGNLQLTPTSVLLNINGRLQPERPLPADDSLIIQSSKAGKPLHAQISGGPRHWGNGFLSNIGSVAGLAPLPTGGFSNGLYALDSLAQRSGQSSQYEPTSYTLKEGTRCRVYVNRSFVINF